MLITPGPQPVYLRAPESIRYIAKIIEEPTTYGRYEVLPAISNEWE